MVRVNRRLDMTTMVYQGTSSVRIAQGQKIVIPADFQAAIRNRNNIHLLEGICSGYLEPNRSYPADSPLVEIPDVDLDLMHRRYNAYSHGMPLEDISEIIGIGDINQNIYSALHEGEKGMQLKCCSLFDMLCIRDFDLFSVLRMGMDKGRTVLGPEITMKFRYKTGDEVFFKGMLNHFIISPYETMPPYCGRFPPSRSEI